MKSFSTAARLSVALVCLTTTILLAGQSLGLVPDSTRATINGRKELCETIAVYCSQAAQSGDISAIRDTARIVMSRNPEILSMAVVRSDGREVFEVGEHKNNWKPLPSDVSTLTQVQIPIFQHQDRWGTVQIRFSPLHKTATLGILESPAFRLTVFVAVAGYISYLLYLRKTLRVLDPSSVIPDRVKAMLETLAEGVLILDRQERIVLANQAFAATIGRLSADLQGLDASQLKWTLPHSDQRPDVLPWTTALQTGELQKGVPLTLIGGPRGSRTVTVNAAPITSSDGHGRARGVLLTIDDVTMIEAKNAQLKDMLEMLRRSRDEIDRQNKELHAAATTDPLTGCRNRRAFYEDFQKAWAAGERYHRNIGCVMVDVDHFKRVNDVHGHAAGDMVLQAVAGLLRSMARETDVVCRYGGEEFCILLPETDLDAAARAGERYRRAIAQKPCGNISVTVSVGCAATGLGAESPSQLMEQADKSLYAAKRTGRDRVVRFDRMPVNVPELPPRSHEAETDTGHSRTTGDREGHGDVPIAFHAVTALMSALAHRDKQTAEHSRRVADLCVAAGRSLLSLRDCFVLEVAALLHDVGKLGVPDSILLKPGPLTDDEWTVMRTHDQMGMEITAAAFGSDELTRIVRMHHSRFGGKANDPDMPSGQEIPLPARILSIADAYDAMVSDRPYRRALTPEQAFKELRSSAGRQFDPELVEHFIKAISTFTSGLPRGAQLPASAIAGAGGGENAVAASIAGTASPFAKARALQHSSQASLDEAMSDLNESIEEAVKNPVSHNVEAEVRAMKRQKKAESETMNDQVVPMSKTSPARQTESEELEFAEAAEDKAPAAIVQPAARRPTLGKWNKAARRSVAASDKGVGKPAAARAPVSAVAPIAKSVARPIAKAASALPTTPAAAPAAAQVSNNELSAERALRMRLEIERLACAAEAGAVQQLTQMAAGLCASARAEGLAQVADRASALVRSAAIADSDSIIRVTNELLRLCRSAHKLDTSRGIRSRLAWRTKTDSPNDVQEIPAGEALEIGTETLEEDCVEAKVASPLVPPIVAEEADRDAEVELAASADIAVPAARPLFSPFAIQPLSARDKRKSAPEALEIEHDVMHEGSGQVIHEIAEAAPEAAGPVVGASTTPGPRMVKVTSMTHLPGTPPPGSAQPCIVVPAKNLKDCSLNAA